MYAWTSMSLAMIISYSVVPYTAISIQGNLCGCHGFHSIVNLFLQIVALLFCSTSPQKCYSENFAMNSHFPIKTWKFLCGCFLIIIWHKSFIYDHQKKSYYMHLWGWCLIIQWLSHLTFTNTPVYLTVPITYSVWPTQNL